MIRGTTVFIGKSNKFGLLSWGGKQILYWKKELPYIILVPSSIPVSGENRSVFRYEEIISGCFH